MVAATSGVNTSTSSDSGGGSSIGSGGNCSGGDRVGSGGTDEQSDEIPSTSTGIDFSISEKNNEQLILCSNDFNVFIPNDLYYNEIIDVVCNTSTTSPQPPVSSPVPIGSSLSIERHRRPSYTCTPFPYRRNYAVRRKTAPFIRLVVYYCYMKFFIVFDVNLFFVYLIIYLVTGSGLHRIWLLERDYLMVDPKSF